MRSIREGTLLCAGIVFLATAASAEVGRRPLVAANYSNVLASSANVQGQFGAYFKTRVTLTNPNLAVLKLDVVAATPSGPLPRARLTLLPGQVLVSDNFLDETFQYTGGAALLFQTRSDNIDPHAPFLLTAEVYAEGASGRFSTYLPVLGAADRVASRTDAGASFSPGVVIDGNNRANVGCVNFDATNSVTIAATLVTGSGTHLWNNAFSLQPQQWQQVPVNLAGLPSGSTLSFHSLDASMDLYCYAVNVNNASNDGTQIPAIYVVPSPYY